MFLFSCDGDHRDLPVLTHSFPTRRSSDLVFSISASGWGGTRTLGSGSGACSLESRTAAVPSNTCIAAFAAGARSEEHTSELQSLMRISYAVFCLKKKTWH